MIQIHIFHAETIGEHKVKCMSFAMAGMLICLIKAEVKKEEEEQQTWSQI